MKNLLIILLIISAMGLTACNQFENKTADQNGNSSQEVISKEEINEVESDLEFISPDKTVKVIRNNSGLALVSSENKILKYILSKEELIAHGFECRWSSDSGKICIIQYGEEFSTFSIYDIKNDKLTFIRNAKGLEKTKAIQGSSYDWYAMTFPIEWLDNDRILFDVNHQEPLDSSNPPSYERGCREDVFEYSIDNNLFTNLTNSKDGEYYQLKEINNERHVLIIDVFVRGNENVEMVKKNEIEISY